MKKCLLAFVLLILPSMCMIAQNNVQYRKGTGQVYDRVGCEEKDGYRIVVLNGKYGIADKYLNETVSPKYDDIEEYGIEKHKGFWIVELNGLRGVITSLGQEILPCKFKYINKYREYDGKYNPTWIVSTEEGTGVYDDSGREIIPCIYDRISGGADYFVVTMRNKDHHREYALFNDSGRMVTHVKYTGGITRVAEDMWIVHNSVQDTNPGCEAIFWKSYGIINSKGEELVPLKYDYIGHSIAENRIVVKNNKGKYGFLDTSNLTEVIPLQYDYATGFANGYSAVMINKTVGFINKDGKIVIPCVYEPDGPMVLEGAPFSVGCYEFSRSGVTFVKKNGLYGLIDKNGKELSSFAYKRVYYDQLERYYPSAFEVRDINEERYYMSLSGTVFIDKNDASNDSYEYVKAKVTEGNAYYYELFGNWCFYREEYKEARKWLLTGYANKGYLEFGEETLGIIYEYGLGCDKNLEEAREWYQMAIDSKGQLSYDRYALDRVQKALSE